MLRTIRVRSRFIYQNLTYLSQSNLFTQKTLLNSSSPSNLVLSAPFSHTVPLQNNEYSSDRRLFVVQPRLRPETVLKLKLDEAINLANSLAERRDDYYFDDEFSEELPKKKETPHVVVQNPAARSIRPDTYFGKGTVNTIKILLDEANTNDELFAVFVNATLTGIQQRNLETEWDIPVLDRVGLIIEIFKAHAETKEAKLQAELAALMYKRTRLVRVRGPDGRSTFGASGDSEVVSARGRGSGGRGFIGGAGETELQLQRRRILYLRSQLLSEIREVRRTRAVQRASRKRNGNSDGQDMPTVAIVGYTNAGKSTLVSELSQTYLYSDDRLFATVDPKLRSVILPSGRKVLLSDTVGFISDLPVQLVEAFQATLEEVVEADLLVHVLDSSAPNIDEHRQTVLQVLRQIGVSEEKLQSMIEVYNKIDLQQDEFAEENADSMDDDDNDEDDQSLSDGDTVSDVVDDDYSDGWLLEDEQEDEPDTWADQDRLLSDDQQKESQTELAVPRIETSAVFGVGLQELLEAIDDKLKNRTVVESSNIVNRKWRPPREEDKTTAV